MRKRNLKIRRRLALIMIAVMLAGSTDYAAFTVSAEEITALPEPERTESEDDNAAQKPEKTPEETPPEGGEEAGTTPAPSPDGTDETQDDKNTGDETSDNQGNDGQTPDDAETDIEAPDDEKTDTEVSDDPENEDQTDEADKGEQPPAEDEVEGEESEGDILQDTLPGDTENDTTENPPADEESKIPESVPVGDDEQQLPEDLTPADEEELSDPQEEEIIEVRQEWFDLGDTATSAPDGISLFSMTDGKVELKSGSHVNWIDRINVPDYAVKLYHTLVEASDNDGTADYLIDDYYFTKEEDSNFNGIEVATIERSSALSQSEMNYVYNCIRAAYDAFDRDHPEVFWMSGENISNCAIYTIRRPDGTFGYRYVFCFVTRQYQSDGTVSFDIRAENYRSQSAVKAAISTRERNISAILNTLGGDRTQKIKDLNHWLTTHNEYNTDLNQAYNSYPEAWECISALAGEENTRGPVCEGYARAFKVICDRLSIPCVLVDGLAASTPSSGGGAHMWNYVEIDENWYAVDVTWNDPVIYGKSGALSGFENEDWLLLSSDSPVSDGWSFIQSHPVSNTPSRTSFTNGPQLCKVADQTKTSISQAEIAVALPSGGSYVYNGSARKPGVTVRLGGKALVKDRDYKVSYQNNTNAGTAKVIITAIGSYRGTKEQSFKIAKATNTLTLPKTSFSYNASPSKTQTFSIGAKVSGGSLTYKSSSTSITVSKSGTVTIPKNYKGSVKITVSAPGNSNYNAASAKTITLNVNTIANQITASNVTKSASTAAQSFYISAKRNGSGKITYSSNSKSVTVSSSGKVTIAKNFTGKAVITIKVAASGIYKAASKTITVTVNPISSKITASNFTKTFSSSAQSFYIGAKRSGSGKITYSSNNKSVTVNSSGKVTIAKKFTGKAVITIKVAASGIYKTTSKTITVTVNPAKTTLSSVKNSASKKLTVTWKKNTAVTGYQIQYSTDKSFKTGTKTVTVSKYSTVSTTISKLTKGKTYYVRIRTYKTVSGTKYYSGWSTPKAVKISK